MTTTVASGGGLFAVSAFIKGAGVAGGAGGPTSLFVSLPTGQSRAENKAPVGAITFDAGDEIYLIITTFGYTAGGVALAAVEVVT